MANPSLGSVAAGIGLRTHPTSTLPTGATNGDVLVAMVHADTGGTTPPTCAVPTGWTQLYTGNRFHGGGDSMTWLVAWIKVGGSAPSTAWTSDAGYNEITTICVQDSDGTIAASSSTGADGENATHLPDPPAVTVPSANNLVICGGQTWQGSTTGGWGAPSGYTLRGDT